MGILTSSTTDFNQNIIIIHLNNYPLILPLEFPLELQYLRIILIYSFIIIIIKLISFFIFVATSFIFAIFIVVIKKASFLFSVIFAKSTIFMTFIFEPSILAFTVTVFV